MPMTWDSSANEKLLLTIIATHEIKVDFDAVAASFGPHCTPRAVQEQIKKLKKQAKNEGESTSDQTTPTKTATTAKKPATPNVKVNTKSKASNGGGQIQKKRKVGKGGGGLLSPLSNDGNELDEGATPSKQMASKKTIAKPEDEGRLLGDSGGSLSCGGGTAKAVLAAKRKADEMLNPEDGVNSGVMVKEEVCPVEDDFSDISAFDPADDQLMAEHEFSLTAI